MSISKQEPLSVCLSVCLSLRLVLVKSLANKYSCNLVDIRLSKCPLTIKDSLSVCPFVFTAHPRRYKTLEVSISEKEPVCLPLQHVLADVRLSKYPLVRKSLCLFVCLPLHQVLVDIKPSKCPLVRKSLCPFACLFLRHVFVHMTLEMSISGKVPLSVFTPCLRRYNILEVSISKKEPLSVRLSFTST